MATSLGRFYRKGGADDVAVVDGGTGASDAATALTNLNHDARDHLGVPNVGRIIQVGYVSIGTDILDTVGIPVDNTIPQITEGTQALSLAFTPIDSNSELHFEIVTHIGFTLGGGGHGVTALFQVGVSDALAVADQNDTNAGIQSIHLLHRIATAGAGARTYTIRFGDATANNALLNRDATGAFALYGGRMVSAMRILEVAP